LSAYALRNGFHTEDRSNPFDATVDVSADIAIGETKDSIALALQPLLTLEVSQCDVRKALVHAAIDLDDELWIVRREVGEELANRGLASDVRVEFPQLPPKVLFGPGYAPAQAARTRGGR
jgi:hypothetical protein